MRRCPAAEADADADAKPQSDARRSREGRQLLQGLRLLFYRSFTRPHICWETGAALLALA